MILRIHWQNHSVDSEEIAYLIATNAATCPRRLARQFVCEYLTSPSGGRYKVDFASRGRVWFGLTVHHFCGYAIRPEQTFDRGPCWMTGEGVKAAIENSLFRDLHFIEELGRRFGRKTERVLRRDIRRHVRPAVAVLRRLVEADWVPGCGCGSCRSAVIQ